MTLRMILDEYRHVLTSRSRLYSSPALVGTIAGRAVAGVGAGQVPATWSVARFDEAWSSTPTSSP